MAFRIQSKEIEYGKKLGEGGFGEVYKAKWNHINVAVKRLILKNLSESTIKEFENEIKIHLDLRHLHIVQMYGVTSEQPYEMVMEFMENGSLDSYLQKNPQKNVSWSLKYKIALDVIKGLSYLHKNSIIHRDLKSLNILLNKILDAKVCDFGLAKLKAETMSRTGFKGTIQWSAPELFTFKPLYNAKTDVYSYGIILWELASHEYPYKETPPLSVPSLVKEGERETFPENTPKAFEELAEKCWDGKAANRPELESVIMTLESLLASTNESKHVNTYASSYLSPSTLNQSNESGYLQPTTNSVGSIGYLNSSATSTGYIDSFQSQKPRLPNPYPISTTTNSSKQLTINNSSIVQTPQPSYDPNAYWRNLSIEKGIPLVEGQRTDCKADFELLSKLTTVSKLTINRFLGEMIEDMPLISKADFDWLSELDRFEPGEWNKDTYEILVIPSKIRRTKEKEWILDNKGNLIPDPKKQEKTLDVPLTLKNLRTLCSFPLDGKKNTPVFYTKVWDDAFEQCNPASNHACIYFTRKQVVGRSLPWKAQKSLVESKNLEVTPLFIRTWAHCFSILEFNTCLDNNNDRKPKGGTWARTPDTAFLGQNNFVLAVGDFVSGIGMNVNTCTHTHGFAHFGVAPGRSCGNF